jgi:adenylate cyclase
VQGRPIKFTSWNGYGSNIDQIAKAAPMAGFFNSITEGRRCCPFHPLIAEYKGQYYESLSMAMFRMLVGLPHGRAGIPARTLHARSYQGLESILLKQGQTLAVPVDDRVAALVPVSWGRAA